MPSFGLLRRKRYPAVKAWFDIATNIAIITYNDDFRGLLDIMSTLQLKINSELYNFSMEVNQRRKSTQKDFTSLRKNAEEQNSCLEGQLYGAVIAE